MEKEIKKKFVIGDIHGSYKALIQCLRKANFKYESDILICLGDICDGYPYVKQCISEILKIKNVIFVIGNHDHWALDWMVDPYYTPQPDIWLSQGGSATQESYRLSNGEYDIPEEHIAFLRDSYAWYKDDNNNLFVHGGIDPNQQDMRKQNFDTLIWDRDLFFSAWKKHYGGKQDYKFSGYENIFLGHTTTQIRNSLEPIHVCNIWNLDTGCGWNGKLTIMNIDTKEYWQSDLSPKLHPECPGRN